ncbi:hypothetical protein HMI55_001554 [Coelomomyces lativittatus]|nr:hypothetical protein HMI55_001554 [Coelomomyces lativittatus]
MNTSSSALNQTARNSVHTSLPLSLPNLPEVTSSSPNALPPFQTTNHDGVSLRNIDGKASIEHLISIHVQDLLEVSTHPESFSLSEILAGVQYLMDYRIHGGKMPNLDLSIMIKLLDVLLLHMKHTVPSFLGTKKVSNEANQAFVLFVQFTLEVQEARIALADKPVAVLRHALVLHQRLKVPELHVWIQCVLKWFPTWSPQITHWKDIVEESRHSSFMALYKATFSEAFLSSHPLFIPPPLNKRQIYPPPGLYFDRTIEKVRFMFKTDLEKGLHPSQLPDLLSYYGRNQLPDAPKPSLFQVLFSQFKDFMMLVLLIAAVVEFAFNEYDSGGILMAVVLLNAFIGFIQEWRANQVLDALSKLNVPTAKVLRQGPMEIIQATDLVPGDLVVLEEGDWVPADLRITQAYSLEVIESILTGETVPVKKSTLPIRHETRRLPLGDCTTNAFMSTLVAKGRGQGIVVRIGVHTEMGKISKAITSTPALITPIQKKLKVLGMVLVVVAFGLCALVQFL